MKRPKEPLAHTSGADYATWKSGLAAEFERLHGISAGVIPEGVWTRLYVKGMSPEQAAKTPEVYNYVTREPSERLRK